ncbi:hypothetical protein ACFQYP_58070 [Nonomuraea antimicrobica]
MLQAIDSLHDLGRRERPAPIAPFYVIALLRTALPICLAMIAGMVGSLTVTSVLGQHDTVTLAAFAVATAVLNPRARPSRVRCAGSGRSSRPSGTSPRRPCRWCATRAGSASPRARWAPSCCSACR